MIILKNISKSYKNNIVFDKVNYTFEDGNIYCVQGRNGSGKTVLLKMLAGLSEQDEGQIVYDRLDTTKGVIIETPLFWRHMSGIETLRFLASIWKQIDEATMIECMKKTGTFPYKDKRVGGYSLGMRQRLAITQAIMEDPDILLLDEPTNALDDNGVEMFKEVMRQQRQMGKLVVIATHNIADIEDIVDKFVQIRERRLFA